MAFGAGHMLVFPVQRESSEIVVEQSRLPAETGGNYLLDADTNPRVVSINLPKEESDPAQLDAVANLSPDFRIGIIRIFPRR